MSNVLYITKPTNVLEAIMHDSDYECLGRDYYPHVLELLKLELKITDYSKWKHDQIQFLKHFKYETKTAKNTF